MVIENLRIATTALRANLMRSILTTLGIIIGVAAVIAVVSIVQGLQSMLTAQLETVGATFIQVVPRQGFSAPGLVTKEVKLTWEDGQEIRRLVRGVALITPQIAGNQEAKYRDRSHRSTVIGVTDAWPEVNNFAVERGRFFSRLDLDRRNRVAVVGKKVLEELRIRDGIGTEIYVGQQPFTIVGIMEEKGNSLGRDFDDMIFLPFDTSLLIFGRQAGDRVQLLLQAESSEMVDLVRDGIKRVLRTRHRIPDGQNDDFIVVVQDEIREVYGQVLGGVTAVVVAIVGISLIVGGIGIMNIMLVSVTERTREIGLRKSVGARKRDILLQFLIEAVTLSLLGGVIGVFLGYGVGAIAVNLAPVDLPPAYVPPWAVALAFGFCTVVGIGFGIYPAGKAAALDPIEALRYE